jgi:hypothetical protein
VNRVSVNNPDIGATFELSTWFKLQWSSRLDSARAGGHQYSRSTPAPHSQLAPDHDLSASTLSTMPPSRPNDRRLISDKTNHGPPNKNAYLGAKEKIKVQSIKIKRLQGVYHLASMLLSVAITRNK